MNILNYIKLSKCIYLPTQLLCFFLIVWFKKLQSKCFFLNDQYLQILGFSFTMREYFEIKCCVWGSNVCSMTGLLMLLQKYQTCNWPHTYQECWLSTDSESREQCSVSAHNASFASMSNCISFYRAVSKILKISFSRKHVLNLFICKENTNKIPVCTKRSTRITNTNSCHAQGDLMRHTPFPTLLSR